VRRLHRLSLVGAGLIALGWMAVTWTAGDGFASRSLATASLEDPAELARGASRPGASARPQAPRSARIVAVFERGDAGRDGGGPVSVVGIDPDAPRPLQLWVSSEPGSGPAARLVGRTHSAEDGSFATEGLLISRLETRIVALPLASLPEPGVWRDAAQLPRSPRLGPRPTAWRTLDGLAFGLHESPQVVWLAGPSRREPTRIELPAGPRPGAVWRYRIEDVSPAEPGIDPASVAWFAGDPPAGREPAWQHLVNVSGDLPSTTSLEESP